MTDVFDDGYFRRIERLRAAGFQLPHIAETWGSLVGTDRAQLAAAIRRPDLSTAEWLSMSPKDREQIVLAFRRAVLLGRVCAQALRDEADQPTKGNA